MIPVSRRSAEEGIGLPTPGFLGFPGGSAGKESTCNVENPGDLGSIPGLGRSPGEGNGSSQYSGLENPMDCIVRGVTNSQTRLSDFHFHITLYTLLDCFDDTLFKILSLSLVGLILLG